MGSHSESVIYLNKCILFISFLFCFIKLLKRWNNTFMCLNPNGTFHRLAKQEKAMWQTAFNHSETNKAIWSLSKMVVWAWILATLVTLYKSYINWPVHLFGPHGRLNCRDSVTSSLALGWHVWMPSNSWGQAFLSNKKVLHSLIPPPPQEHSYYS